MTISTVCKRYENRFSQINPGRMDWRFWAARNTDPNPKPDEKFTLEEARAKLKEQGSVVMSQQDFNKILDEKYGTGFNKGKSEAEGSLSEEQKEWKKAFEEVPKLKSKIEAFEKEKPDLIPKSEHEALLKAKDGEISKRDERITGLKNVQRDNDLLEVIGGKAVNPDVVLKLLRDQFTIDDEGNVYPINEKGEKLIDSEGIVDIGRKCESFFKENPYLAKASDSSGAGSGSSASGGGDAKTGGKYTIEQLNAMSDEEFDKVGGMGALAD